jgi:hypothetical protein
MRKTFTILENFVTLSEYARLCGVHPDAITKRFKNGRISGVVIYGKLFIDAETSPPKGRIQGRGPKAPAPKLPADFPPLSELVCLLPWVYKHKVTAGERMTAILFGRVQAWGMGDQVIVRRHDLLPSGK